jgi:hypothetical protein
MPDRAPQPMKMVHGFQRFSRIFRLIRVGRPPGASLSVYDFQGSTPCPAVATGDENGGRHPVLTRGVRLCSGQYAMPCGRHGG